MKLSASVDDYIGQFPPEAQERLQAVRRTVAKAAPGATERISYGMPTYELHGHVAHFAAYRRHIGLYGVVHEDGPLAREAAPYLESRSTLRLPLDKPLPVALIKKAVRARVKANKAS